MDGAVWAVHHHHRQIILRWFASVGGYTQEPAPNCCPSNASPRETLQTTSHFSPPCPATNSPARSSSVSFRIGIFLIRTNWTMARFAASLLAASLAVSILPDTAFTQTVQRPPLPLLTPHGRPAAKMENRRSAMRKKQHGKSATTRKRGPHQESADKKQKRADCKEQAQKLLDDADKRAYLKECIF